MPIIRNLSLKKYLGLTTIFGVISIVGGFATGAHAQTPSTVYQGTARDPFASRRVYVPNPNASATRRASAGSATKSKDAVVKPVAKLAVVPDVQARVNRYRALKAEAINAGQLAPKPVTAFLLSEIAVTGIFRTPRGYAAMVEATPIKLSYVIYPGELFFDGQLVAVEENRLVFRRETRYESGKREMSVELKPLRAVDAVRDALTAQKSAAANSAVAPVSGNAAAAASAVNNSEAAAVVSSSSSASAVASGGKMP